MSEQPELRGPILLAPSLHETIWGGDALGRLMGKRVRPGARVGESWETEISTVAENAPYAGSTLGALVTTYGTRLVGQRAVEVFGERFPLLAKFLDANDDLSVQVHPKDAYAREHEGGKLGKTEAWYILQTAPGARLVYGMERETNRDEVRRAIEEQRLEGLLHEAAVQPGDVIFVPAGTVHAIGAGIVLYELQEYSDVTYRLYDYGRRQSDGTLRQLHIEPSLDVMRYGPAGPATVRPLELDPAPGARGRALVGCRYFLLEEWTLAGDYAALASEASCEILTVLEGSVRVAGDFGVPVPMALGQTAVLPAGMGAYHLESDGARVLRSYVPDEADAVLKAWRERQSTDHVW